MTCYGAVQFSKHNLLFCGEKLRLTKINFIQYYKFTIQGCIVQRTGGPLGPVLMIKVHFEVFTVMLTGLAVLFQMPQRRCHSAACYYM